MNVSDFKDWVRTAKRGKRVVYGVSAGDKVPPRDIMEAAMSEYKRGRVELFQKRTGQTYESLDLKGKPYKNGDGKFDYIAVKV